MLSVAYSVARLLPGLIRPQRSSFSTSILDAYREQKTEYKSNRIVHLKVEEKVAPASQIVAAACPPGVDPFDLIRTGSVYRAPVGEFMEAQRILHDVPVYDGEYLRIHIAPRRYNIADIPWDKLVVHHEEDFIVINKPPGMPTVPTVDNYYENVVIALQRLLDVEQLHPVQRLDTDTTGVLVIGKTLEFTSYFNKLMRQNQVSKVYKALVAGAVIPDSELSTKHPIVHYTPKDTTIRPRQFTLDPSQHAESKLCELSILSKRLIGSGTFDEWMSRLEIPLNGFPEDDGKKRKLQRALESYFNISSGDQTNRATEKEIAFAELELELVTGRTHQIRGQLACIGTERGGGMLHVAGDNMYAGMSSVEYIDKFKSSPYLALQAKSVGFRYRGNYYEFQVPNPWWHKLSKLA